MAKTARRSVASDPSSQATNTNHSNIHNKNQKHQLGADSSAYSFASAANAATPDPLRPSGSQFTTRIIPSDYESSRYGNGSTIQSIRNNSNNSILNGHHNQYSPLPTNGSLGRGFNVTSQAKMLAAERERIRMEFYATYDVMTGVRIAATLGGFFGLMVFLIVWKSRSHSNETLKVLKDPKIAAVAAACMQEEEDREIQEAMQATGLSIYPDEYDAMLFRRQRMLSLGNVSAPPVLHRGHRFSSMVPIAGGSGYSSLLEPPRRFSYSYGASGQRPSGSESFRHISNYPMGNSFGTDDYFVETDDELENPEFENVNGGDGRESLPQPPGFLMVPAAGQHESRRSSAMTCCSTESSYLERRCSALTLGLNNLPPTLRRKLSTTSRASSTDVWDYYYPDIQIIEPTPKVTPCPSERSSNGQLSCQSKRSPEEESATQAHSLPAHQPVRRKYSVAYFDPETAQTGGRQQVHSISTDYKTGRSFYSKVEVNEKRKTSDKEASESSATSVRQPKRAPLASLSSFKMSSLDCQDSEMRSLEFDSVFLDSIADTDDDMEQFSTDSDEDSIGDIPIDTTPTQTSVGFSGSLSLNMKSSKRIRPVLQRHQTISPSPSDTIFFPLQELTTRQSEIQPKPVSASSSPLISRKPSIIRHLQQQTSDPQSLPTTTDDTTPETCSTLNTEILQDMPTSSSNRTIISFSRDNNNDSSLSSSHIPSPKKTATSVPIIVGVKLKKEPDDETNSCSSSFNHPKNVEVNVVIENIPIVNVSTSSSSSRNLSKSTSEIHIGVVSPSDDEPQALELPTITTTTADSSFENDSACSSESADGSRRNSNDPNWTGGSTRQWSKETLF